MRTFRTTSSTKHRRRNGSLTRMKDCVVKNCTLHSHIDFSICVRLIGPESGSCLFPFPSLSSICPVSRSESSWEARRRRHTTITTWPTIRIGELGTEKSSLPSHSGEMTICFFHNILCREYELLPCDDSATELTFRVGETSAGIP